MRARSAFVVAAAMVAALALSLTPASAASSYQMNGQGNLTIAGGGLPSCMAGQGDCANVDTTFSWGELTVQGAGLLQDNAVAGQYKCKSEGTGYESRIRGNTSNFELVFNFKCTVSSGIGPSVISGWFSNGYRSVSGHLHPTPVAPGAPFFKGYFRAANVDPDTVNASNGDAMSCGGGFAPTGMSGLRIQTALFLGSCQAADA